MTVSNDNENLEQKQSLESLASPEQLDQLMQVVKPKDFIPAIAVGGFTVMVLVWSVVGRIPVTVSGQGVLTSPQRILELQSPLAGQLESLLIKDNQCVKKGEILATIKPTELEEQLKLQQAKQQQLSAQAANTDSLQRQRTQVERDAIASTRTSLLQRLRDIQSLSPSLKDQGLITIAQQRQTLQQRLQDTQALASVSKERELSAIEQQRRTFEQQIQSLNELNPVLKKRLDIRNALQKEGAISTDSILEAENAYRENRNQVSSIQAQLKELSTKEIGVEKSFRENRNQVSDIQTQLQQLNTQEISIEKSFRDNRSQVTDIQAQLQELDSRSKRLEQDNLQASNDRKNEIAEVERTIAQLEQQIKERSLIESPQEGCILEVSSVLGQVVSPGTRLGTLKTQEQGKVQLTSIAYFDVKDGKRIKPEMKMQITPDTVKRERFGGIVATVKSVSPYPVTSTTAASKLGNAELADAIAGKTPKVEVIAELVPESSNVSGYKWSSSKGPDTKLTAGTTTALRVTVEERAPITFLLPFLREWSGLQ
ncbi:MAG TPA: NHLP bacteriocin system secretion protein [Cyanobacteria bacterium UBA8803]|nr:NHLP bacteriocin system secretion protein [Cyanobacteria bacterium UBA9273]HBL59793.1 NHLP bacteriocin system secretion protein [Cyanobacteria bacterium UBA8803]